MQMLTIKEAILKAPSIDYESSDGKHIPTKDILKGILSKGWILKDAIQEGNRAFTQHCAVIVHEDTLRDDVALQQGYPQLYIWNTKKDVCFLLGWYDPVNNTDFITPKSFIQDSVFAHKKNKPPIDEIVNKLNYSRVYFESINNTIEEAKNRILNNMEMLAFANYVTDIRYRKKKKPYNFNSFSLLSSSKIDNDSRDLWIVSNIIFNNIINGSKNGGNGIKSFKERLFFSWKFWQGFIACTIFEDDSLFYAFFEIANEL
jgi:hypothetical protein